MLKFFFILIFKNDWGASFKKIKLIFYQPSILITILINLTIIPQENEYEITNNCQYHTIWQTARAHKNHDNHLRTSTSVYLG